MPRKHSSRLIEQEKPAGREASLPLVMEVVEQSSAGLRTRLTPTALSRMISHKRPVGSLSTFRLFVLFVAVAFSFGGFSFYAAVVVPIGGEVFDVTSQGFVTRRVTHVINAASALTLAAFVWEGLTARSKRRRWENGLFIALVAILGACLLSLVALHPRLDVLLDDRDFSVAEPARFYGLHRVYLWNSSVQWLATLVMIWLICSAYRERSAL